MTRKWISNRYLVEIRFLAGQEWHSWSNVWLKGISVVNSCVDQLDCRGLSLSVFPPLSLLSLSRLHCVVSHVSALHNTVLVFF